MAEEGREGPRRFFNFDENLKHNGRVVLIVDDSGMMRHMVAEVVRKIGFDPVEAGSAEEATALADYYEPRLMVLDIQMPGASGLEALEQMRQTEKLFETPVIMLTVEAFRDSFTAARRLGVEDYLVKPVHADLLEERLRQLLK